MIYVLFFILYRHSNSFYRNHQIYFLKFFHLLFLFRLALQQPQLNQA